LREEQKRRKADKDNPTYVPEVPRKTNPNKKSDTASNKAEGVDSDVVSPVLCVNSLII
jgi:hypothetical protein